MDTQAESSIMVDPVLLSAWRRLMYYDQISCREKTNFTHLRKVVILLIFFGSVASIAVMLLDLFSLSQESLSFIGILALALPIVALAVMQYTARFAAPTTWIQYRYAAEKIRSNIYQYRTGSGVYNTEPHQRDDLLYEAIAASERIITNAVPLTEQRKRSNLAKEQSEKLNQPLDKTKLEDAKKEIEATLRSSGEGDDGFSTPLPIEQYIQTRIYGQHKWYRGRVDNDYRLAKRFTAYALAVTACGSILGLILGSQQVQFVGLVALANAASVAINGWGNVLMFGRTYGIYDRAARQLLDAEALWHARKNNPDFAQNERHYQNDFVQQVEAILMNELDTWYSIATETQLNNDEMLIANIQDLQAELPSSDAITQHMINQLRELPPQKRTQQLEILRSEMAKLEAETQSSTDNNG